MLPSATPEAKQQAYTLEAPTDEIVFNKPVYQSDLQDALKAALEDFIANGDWS